jgi:hypothetical protein
MIVIHKNTIDNDKVGNSVRMSMLN